MSENKFTCLHDKHVALGALMSPFAGYDMPIQYKDITTEHEAVRHNVGVFDVSHMGEVDICGHAAASVMIFLAFLILWLMPLCTSSFITKGLNSSIAISFGRPH